MSCAVVRKNLAKTTDKVGGSLFSKNIFAYSVPPPSRFAEHHQGKHLHSNLQLTGLWEKCRFLLEVTLFKARLSVKHLNEGSIGRGELSCHGNNI
jgi:hypothetical protein